jgi:hypothetical protein
MLLSKLCLNAAAVGCVRRERNLGNKPEPIAHLLAAE